jgi:hypothetical protein
MSRFMRLVVFLGGAGWIPQLLGGQAATTQEGQTPPMQSSLGPSPGAIYKSAMHPLDVVRSSLDNWSDAELSALNVGMRKAAAACAQARPEDYSGDDLYDLARLCSLGQEWAGANKAAARYVDSHAQPHRTQAYVLIMNAQMHLGMKEDAFQTANMMLRELPYDAEVAYALRYLKDTLEREGNPGAAALAGNEQQELLDALSKGMPLKAAYGDAVMSVGALYESAMEAAFWQAFEGDAEGAAKAAAACDGRLTNSAGLPDEDRQRIAGIQTQIGLLGKRLPEIRILRSLQGEKAKGEINPNYGVATVLVLFPDWCAQCRKMMKTMTAFAVMNGETPIHAYGLMFAEDGEDAGGNSSLDAAKEVQGTATLLVTRDAAVTLGAVDYPLGIVVDGEGKVRYVGVLPGDAFNGDGYIERVLKRMSAVAATAKRVDAKSP